MAKRKRPKRGFDPSPTKRPAADERAAAAWRNQPIQWSFRKFDGILRDTCNGHDGDQFVDVAVSMKNKEGQTWAQILANRGKDHAVDKGNLAATARKRLSELKMDDVDELLRLRFSGQQRIWGTRQGAVFLALWWDPLHEICPSVLKHT